MADHKQQTAIQGMNLAVHRVGAKLDIVLLILSGYIDTTTCQELTETIQGLIKQEQYLLIVDMSGVTYVSSAGWGVFMGEIKNIRDLGGDLKITQMPPEVFEVFEMLEFNRILNYYDTVEETINEFDIIRGFDITQIDEETRRLLQNTNPEKTEKKQIPQMIHRPSVQKKNADKGVGLRDLPLMEKVKRIVVDNPFLGTRGIARELNTNKYGSVKINWFKMRSILKKLSLDSTEKRHRFYRSR
ncbi:STAS domain-containing protein [candidate division KSB1 bacterium]|nr:STAS domain-containing protein [candidate division KSB1 bacterium]